MGKKAKTQPPKRKATQRPRTSAKKTTPKRKPQAGRSKPKNNSPVRAYYERSGKIHYGPVEKVKLKKAEKASEKLKFEVSKELERMPAQELFVRIVDEVNQERKSAELPLVEEDPTKVDFKQFKGKRLGPVSEIFGATLSKILMTKEGSIKVSSLFKEINSDPPYFVPSFWLRDEKRGTKDYQAYVVIFDQQAAANSIALPLSQQELLTLYKKVV